MNKSLSILIVDDDPGIHRLLKYDLESMFETIYSAGNVARGIDIAKGKHPDLILLDISLPDEDGFKLGRELQSDEVTRDIPIIYLTGKDSFTSIATGMDLGGVDYITKPYNKVELLARIRSALRISKRIEELKSNPQQDNPQEK